MKKICNFYVSDYHFEMISLPYIEKNIEKNKEIIILTKHSLKETITNLVNKTNLKEEKKNKILKIDWTNKNEEKFKKIKNDNKKELLIFIKGTEKYIEDTNKEIEKSNNTNNKITIVNCYDMGEIAQRIDSIMGKYDKILKTDGEAEIQKI